MNGYSPPFQVNSAHDDQWDPLSFHKSLLFVNWVVIVAILEPDKETIWLKDWDPLALLVICFSSPVVIQDILLDRSRKKKGCHFFHLFSRNELKRFTGDNCQIRELMQHVDHVFFIIHHSKGCAEL